MKQPSYIAILGAILSFLSPVTTRCYYPNGNVSDGLACDPHAAVSVCCQREWSCLSNGVCRLLNNTEHFYAFERGSCTDSSWSSPKCPRFCQQPWDFTEAPVAVCSDLTTWCCIEESPYSNKNLNQCCSKNTTLLTLGIGDPRTTIGLAKSITSTGPAEPTTSLLPPTTKTTDTTTNPYRNQTAAVTTTPATPIATRHKSSTHNIAIGVGVGVPLGALLLGLLFLLAFPWWKRHRNEANPFPENSTAHQHADLSNPELSQAPKDEPAGYYKPELLTEHNRHELMTTEREPAELPG